MNLKSANQIAVFKMKHYIFEEILIWHLDLEEQFLGSITSHYVTIRAGKNNS